MAIKVFFFVLLSGRCTRSDTAMTGEITLRGLVLPVRLVIRFWLPLFYRNCFDTFIYTKPSLEKSERIL